MDSRDVKSSASPSLSDPFPLNPSQPSFTYLRPASISSLPSNHTPIPRTVTSNPITPSTTLLPNAPHLATQSQPIRSLPAPQTRPLFASHRDLHTREDMHRPSSSTIPTTHVNRSSHDSHQSHPQNFRPPEVHALPSSSQSLPKLDPFSRPLSHSVMDAQDPMRPTHLPRAAPLSSPSAQRYDITNNHPQLSQEQQLRSQQPPPYNSSSSQNQLPQIHTRATATSPLPSEPLPQMALPRSSQQVSPSIDAPTLRTVSSSVQNIPPQPANSHMQSGSNDASAALNRQSAQQTKSTLESSKQSSRQTSLPRSQFAQLQQPVDLQRSLQPRQPPPLPPRPAMLAPPRGSVVMQDVPRYQRQVVPSVSSHPTHSSQMHDAGSPSGNQQTAVGAMQPDSMKQHGSSVEHQSHSMYHHGVLSNPRQMAPVPAMAQQMPASPTLAMSSGQHGSQQHGSITHPLEYRQRPGSTEDHGNSSAFPRELGKHDRSFPRAPVADLRAPGQRSSGQSPSRLHLDGASRLGARGDGDMHLNASMHAHIDDASSPRHEGEKGPRVFDAESMTTPMRNEEGQSLSKNHRAQDKLLSCSPDAAMPASQRVTRHQRGLSGSVDGRTSTQGQPGGEQRVQEFQRQREVAIQIRGSRTIEDFVTSPQTAGVGGPRSLLESQTKLRDEGQLKRDISPSRNASELSTGLRPPHALPPPGNQFTRNSHERNMESSLPSPLNQVVRTPQGADRQRYPEEAAGEPKDTNRSAWANEERVVEGANDPRVKNEGQGNMFEPVSSHIQASGETTTPANPNLIAVPRYSRPTNSSSRMSVDRHHSPNLVSNQMEVEKAAKKVVKDSGGDKSADGGSGFVEGREGSRFQSAGMTHTDSKKKPVPKERAMSHRQGPNRPTTADDNGATQRRQLKVEDALAYLEKVKSQFSDQLSVYNQFLDIMKEFKADSIDTNEVIRRVSNLFRGHKDLILGFNTFLPPGYKIRVIENAKTGILNPGFLGPAGVFNPLPPHRKIPSKMAGLRPGARKRVNAGSGPKEKDSKHLGSTSDCHMGPSTSSIGNDQHEDVSLMPTSAVAARSATTGGIKSAPVRRAHGLDGGNLQNSRTLHQSVSKIGGTEARAHEFERAIGFVTAIKERFADSPDTFNEFLDALRRFREEQKSIREVFEAVADLFGPHKDLLSQFKEFIPTIAFSGLQDTKALRDRGPSQVSRRTPTTKVISESTPSRRPGALSVGAMNGRLKPRHRVREMQFFEDMKAQLGPNKAHLYTEFIKCLSLFSQGIVSKEELLHLTGEILHDDQDAHASFLDYLDAMANTGEGVYEGEHQFSSSISSEGEPTAVDAARMAYYTSKPMSEIAAEAGIEQMHSYRRMPHDFPPCEYSGRSLQEKRTLNDTWINVTTGSEDYSFKFMRRNQNEDNLFRCEDDRYELDLVIETNASTIMKLETIVATMSKLPLSEKKRHALAPGALTPIHFNAIQRIYGDSGPEVVSQLKMNPSVAVPVVLKRLKEKDITWRGARMDMNKVWREVGERNFHRSLDHRSSHFKAVDKKDLSAKSLLMDIMDPIASVSAREAEMTRARGYAVENGGGGANHRSQALKAVLAAAQFASDRSSRRLELKFEQVQVHRVVYQLIRDVVDDDASKRSIVHFGEIIQSFFGICFEQQQTSTRNRATQSKNEVTILYGDDSVYIVLRLYHLLFERVALAFDLAQEQIANRERRARLNERGRRRLAQTGKLVNVETKPWQLTKALNNQDVDGKFSLGPATESLEEISEQFLELAKQSARAKLDWSRYEDKCRTLLGVDSYALFTIDKTIQKLIKAIETMFGGDPATKGFVELFYECQNRLTDVKMNGGRLDTEGIEVLYSVAASRHLADVRGTGANLIRFQSSWDEVGRGTLLIHVIGQIGDENRTKVVSSEKAVLDQFLEFCGSYGDCNAHGTGVEEKDVIMSDKPSVTSGGDANARHFVKSKRGSGSRKQGLQRGRGGSEFLRYRTDEQNVSESLQCGSLIIDNSLEWRLDGKGVMRYATGSCDFLLNRKRKRAWDEGLNAHAMNERCGRTKRMRRLLRLDKNRCEAEQEPAEPKLMMTAENDTSVKQEAQREQGPEPPHRPERTSEQRSEQALERAPVGAKD